ncbi:unnamed protein product [Staurois parvus]|uniref:Uncharacterized protein n=1 Tax=Staurois parvus TaxID=386267 RepID=A0ABN9B0R1_9NEOB|nr:unnamed protein product [Staurois parvus]
MSPSSVLDSTQEGHTIPHYYKGEDLIDIKVEVKSEEEEAYVRDDQQSMEEDGITGTFIEEDTPTEISTVHGREMRKTSEDCLTLSPDWKVENEDITQYSPGENPAPSNVHPAPPSVDGPSDSSYPEEPQTVRDRAGLPTGGASPVLSAGRVCVLNMVLMCIKDFRRGRSRIPVLSVGNVFQTSPVYTNIRDLTWRRSRIPVLSVGNVFQTSPIFTHIRDLTRGRSRIPVLSVGNVFQKVQSSHTSEISHGGEAVFLS